MYKTNDGKEQEVDMKLQHFIGQYLNVDQLDASAEVIYGATIHAIGRLIDDLCLHGYHDQIKPEDISSVFQHLTSFKITYERMMETILKLAKVANENIKG